MNHQIPRSAAFLALLLLATPTTVFGQDKVPVPPVSYIGQNTGTNGFLDVGGVRLRSATGARGLKAGDFIIWPSLVLEGRYDNNFFRESGTDDPSNVAAGDTTLTNEALDAAPQLRIMPAVAISNPNPSKVSLSLGAGADVRVYISDEENISDHTNVGVNGDFRLGILPKGAVTVWLVDTFRRTLNAAFAEASGSYNKNDNSAGATVSIHPGGGALDISLGYRYALTRFDHATEFDNDHHDLMFRTTWRFYPKTLALVEVTANFWSWAGEPRFDGLNVDNMQIRAYAGLSGYITKRLATLFKVGYGNSLHDSGPSYESVIGQAELQYKFSTRVLGAVGYLRDYRTGYWSNFIGENRPYMRWQLGFSRVSINLVAAYGLLDYAEFDPAAEVNCTDNPDSEACTYQVSEKERRDHQLTGHLGIDINVTRWLGITVGYEFNAVLTDYDVRRFIPATQNGTQFTATLIDPGEYTRHQVYTSLNFRY